MAEPLTDFKSILEHFTSLPADKQAEMTAMIIKQTKNKPFIPTVGPQSAAYFSKADVLLFGGNPGGGKLLDSSTYVPVPLSTDPSGYKKHGALGAGDYVFGKQGQAVQVYERHLFVYDAKTYEITFSTGEKILACADHLWETWSREERLRVLRSSEEWRAKRREGRPSRAKKHSKKLGVSENITKRNKEKEHDIIEATPSVRTTQEIFDTLYDSEHINHAIKIVEPVRGEYQDLPCDPYLFGLWLGDGFTGQSAIIMMESDWAQIPHPLAKSTIHDAEPPRNQPVLVKRFEELAFVRKLGKKYIPPNYLRASYEQRLELLKGMMDTDGTVCSRGYCELGFSNRELAYGAADIINSLGMKVNIRVKLMKSEKHATHYRMKFIPAVGVFKLPRKLERQTVERRGTTGFRYITDVKPAAPVKMNCLTVEGGLYCIGKEFIVTHNTALEVGLALNEHRRSLIVRKEFVDLVGVLHTLDNIIGQERCYTGGNRPVYRKQEGGIIEFMGLGEDIDSKQGNPHDLICVGKDTPVLMADGTYTVVQDVCAGDMVGTLEGPRRVLNAFPSPAKESVKVTSNGVSQVQSATHKLLTTGGWASLCVSASGTPSWLSLPKICRSLNIFFGRYTGKPQGLSLLPDPPSLGQQLRYAASLTVLRMACMGWLENVFDRVLVNQGSASVASGGTAQGTLRPKVSLGWILKRLLPLRAKGALVQKSVCSSAGCGVNDAPRKSELQDYQGCCCEGFHLCDERTHESLGRYVEQEGGQQGLLLLVDAALQSPNDLLGDGEGQAQICTSQKWWYDHPYRRGKRQSTVPVSVHSYSITPVGKVELFDLEIEEVNHFITFGGYVNKNCVDEVAQVPEYIVRMLLGWLRTDIAGQRCRMVLGSNPPLNSVGDWLIEFFAPWLNPIHPNPAQEGELRYFLPNESGIGDREVGKEDFMMLHGVKVGAQSRTYISSRFTDNPYYDPEQYAKSLAGLPDEARNILMSGNFMLDRRDDIWQTIPTAWVKAAQARWNPVPPTGVPMCAIGCDIAQGGSDNTVLAIRMDGWYAPMIVVPGKDTPDGKTAAGVVIKHRRNGAKVIVDIGGGWGGDAYAHLRENKIDAISYMGVKPSNRRTADKMLKFFNTRAEAYWRFREALDPSQPQGSTIALPPDSILVADLCAPMYEIGAHGIKMESKEDLVKRLGRSPDRGDATVMAWFDGLKQMNVEGGWANRGYDGLNGGTPKVILRRR